MQIWTARSDRQRRPSVGIALLLALTLLASGAMAAESLGGISVPGLPARGADAGGPGGVAAGGDEERAEQAEQAEQERAEAEQEREEQRRIEQREREREQREQERREQEQREQERREQEEREQERREQERREAERQAEREAEQQREDNVTAQTRLQEQGYFLGAVDGEQDQQAIAATMAFQAVNGLAVDGVVGPNTLEALQTPVAPSLAGGPATRIEVDLDRQVLHLVEGGARTATLKVSSGNGADYERADGSTAQARTPVGEFTIERRIEGVRESSAGLGTLFDPMYFFTGFALHGSNSVPAGPASHGCVRLSRADAVWLFDRVPNGTPVHLYGGEHTFIPA